MCIIYIYIIYCKKRSLYFWSSTHNYIAFANDNLDIEINSGNDLDVPIARTRCDLTVIRHSTRSSPSISDRAVARRGGQVKTQLVHVDPILILKLGLSLVTNDRYEDTFDRQSVESKCREQIDCDNRHWRVGENKNVEEKI